LLLLVKYRSVTFNAKYVYQVQPWATLHSPKTSFCGNIKSKTNPEMQIKSHKRRPYFVKKKGGGTTHVTSILEDK